MGNLSDLRPDDRENLRKRWQVYKNDMEWTSCKEFMLWAVENGYKKGLHLKKIDESKKYGPNNTRYEDCRAKMVQRTEKHKEFMATRSPYCEGCTHNLCPGQGTGGCEGWKQYWIANWNKNIRYVPNATVEEKPKKSEVFRYEHPDLVREGIVFEASR